MYFKEKQTTISEEKMTPEELANWEMKMSISVTPRKLTPEEVEDLKRKRGY